jgi:short-subunit dehydrogenase
MMITMHSGNFALLVVLIFGAIEGAGFAGTAESAAGRESRFAGNTFVVVGATSGLGYGVALELGRRHANVVLAAERTDSLRDVAREVRARGGTALVVTADPARAADMSRVRHEAVRRFGQIDAWINAAGVGVITRWGDAPPDDYSRLIDVDIDAVRFGSREAIQQFRSQRHGTLVNVGSVDSNVPLTYQAAYSATKTKVLGFGRALNRELRRDGLGRTVKVATVIPKVEDPPRRDHNTRYVRGKSKPEILDMSPKTVDVIVEAAAHPREEVPVPWGTSASYVARQLAPDFVQIISDEMRE